MRQVNINTIPSQAAATLNSNPIPAMNLFYMSAQLTAVGSGAAGTLKFQASNDNNDSGETPPTNWSDIPSATVSISGAGPYLIPKTDCCYQYVRLVYTNSGTGTISVVFKALGD